MRRGVFAAIFVAAFMVAGTPVDAQVRIKPQTMQLKPNVKVQPKVNKPQVMIIKPIIPPSQAVKNIVRAMPGAKVLKMVNLPTGDIVATIRLPTEIRKVRVNGRTGAVQP